MSCLCAGRWGVTAAIGISLCTGLRIQAESLATKEMATVPPLATDDYQAPLDPRELLKVDDAMRRYFGTRIAPYANDYDRLQQIVDAILLPDGLGFTYDAAGTFEARETFRRRRGNCASYAFLVVAIAREFGLEAMFQSVRQTRRWARVGDLVMVVLHLDVRVASHGQLLVVDLDPDLRPVRENLEVIRDERACAQFYSNIGIRLAAQGRPEEALRYLTLAAETDPLSATAWANRATLFARTGALAQAKADFEQAMRVDPHYENALDGYVAVLRALGSAEDVRLATKLERRAQRVRERNPYFLQQLALRARADGDWLSANKYLRRAIARKNDEPEFFVEWIDVLTRLGRPRDAQRADAKLQELREKLAREQGLASP